jgi:hypothetical protein
MTPRDVQAVAAAAAASCAVTTSVDQPIPDSANSNSEGSSSNAGINSDVEEIMQENNAMPSAPVQSLVPVNDGAMEDWLKAEFEDSEPPDASQVQCFNIPELLLQVPEVRDMVDPLIYNDYNLNDELLLQRQPSFDPNSPLNDHEADGTMMLNEPYLWSFH